MVADCHREGSVGQRMEAALHQRVILMANLVRRGRRRFGGACQSAYDGTCCMNAQRRYDGPIAGLSAPKEADSFGPAEPSQITYCDIYTVLVL